MELLDTLLDESIFEELVDTLLIDLSVFSTLSDFSDFSDLSTLYLEPLFTVVLNPLSFLLLDDVELEEDSFFTELLDFPFDELTIFLPSLSVVLTTLLLGVDNEWEDDDVVDTFTWEVVLVANSSVSFRFLTVISSVFDVVTGAVDLEDFSPGPLESTRWRFGVFWSYF